MAKMKDFTIKICLFILSVIIAYFLHYKIVLNLVDNLLFIDSEVFNNFLLFFEITIIFFFLNFIYHAITDQKYSFTASEKDIFTYIYVTGLIIALFTRHVLPYRYEDLISLSWDGVFDFSGGKYTKFVYLFNFFSFFPLGLLYKTKIRYVLVLFLGIEILQLVLKVGRFDLSDFGLYCCGYFLGYIIRHIYLFFKHRVDEKKEMVKNTDES